MHSAIAHHPLTDAQTDLSSGYPSDKSPQFIAQCDIVWYGISFWPVWVSCPCCTPPSFLLIPSLLTGRAMGEAEKSFTQYKQCSATTKTSVL